MQSMRLVIGHVLRDPCCMEAWERLCAGAPACSASLGPRAASRL